MTKINWILLCAWLSLIAGIVGYQMGKHQQPVANPVVATAAITPAQAAAPRMSTDPDLMALQHYADTQEPQLRSNLYCIIAAHSCGDDEILGVLLRHYAEMRLQELQGTNNPAAAPASANRNYL